MIADNIKNVRNRIETLAEKQGFTHVPVLLCVSKTIEPALILEAYNCGCRVFGENKVQELRDKQDSLPHDIEWHFIGHLQTNKVKYLVGRTALIHSVDSIRLVREIERQAVKKDVSVDVLLQVNTSHEESKFGIDAEQLGTLVTEAEKCEHVCIRGLMTMAPFTDQVSVIRECFTVLRMVRDTVRQSFPQIDFGILSMGMSGDYEIAIEEGSTMVRVGSAIFGERTYS